MKLSEIDLGANRKEYIMKCNYLEGYPIVFTHAGNLYYKETGKNVLDGINITLYMLVNLMEFEAI